MAAGKLSAPGTPLGPCENSCKHIDCQQTRDLAAKHCRICGKPIGYETYFFQEDNWETLVHETCKLEELEEK